MSFKPAKGPNKPVIVVSGLPRSGTSMVMKMLAEGGLEIVTDEIRRADDDNPNGYFELEAVKQLAEGNFGWLNGAEGKAVKVVSSLLEYLPQAFSYKIIFVEREIREILASQQKMLARRGEKTRLSDAEMERRFRDHLKAVRHWLARQPNMGVVYVNYNLLVADAESHCQRIVDFLGIPLDIPRMLSVPNHELYRNRV